MEIPKNPEFYLQILAMVFTLFPLFAFVFIYYNSQSPIHLFLLVVVIITSFVIIGGSKARAENLVKEKKAFNALSIWKSMQSSSIFLAITAIQLILYISAFILLYKYIDTKIGLLLFIYAIGGYAYDTAYALSKKGGKTKEMIKDVRQTINSKLGRRID